MLMIAPKTDGQYRKLSGRGHKDMTRSQGRDGNKSGPKCGRDGGREQDREQKQAEMWRGQGHKAGPGSGKVKSGGWVAY